MKFNILTLTLSLPLRLSKARYGSVFTSVRSGDIVMKVKPTEYAYVIGGQVREQ